MIGKLTAAAAVAILVASAGVASAQTKAHQPRPDAAWQTWQTPYANSYYNGDYWRGVAPLGLTEQRDPYVGTVFEGVAPY